MVYCSRTPNDNDKWRRFDGRETANAGIYLSRLRRSQNEELSIVIEGAGEGGGGTVDS